MTTNKAVPVHQCEGRDRPVDGHGGAGHQCEYKATLFEDGRWYCRIHAPSLVAQRQSERKAKWKAQDVARYAIQLQELQERAFYALMPEIEALLDYCAQADRILNPGEQAVALKAKIKTIKEMP